MPDISDTLAPKSDQLDNIDLRGGPPRVFTVTGVDVRKGAEQPVTVHLAEFPRPWKPGKNMRRVLAHCWGRESDGWTGKRVELYADETVKFGNETPGGTRIARLSHIDGPQSAPILLTQGRPGTYKVEPLPDSAPASAPVDEATVGRNELLAQIKTAAENAGVGLDVVAAEWAEGHDGQAIGEATDVGGLELLRDDLIGRAS
jgi:hypothetical protein